MSAISLRLANSLHRKLSDLARREGISINQLVNSAVAEKMATLMTAEYLEERAKRGTRKKFEAVLAKIPNREPEGLIGCLTNGQSEVLKKGAAQTQSVRWHRTANHVDSLAPELTK